MKRSRIKPTPNGISPESSLPSSTIHEPCRLCGREVICGHMGMLRYDVPVGNPNFGKLYRCPNHQPGEDEQLMARRRKLGNLEFLANKTFDTFDRTAYEDPKAVEMILYQVRDYAEELRTHQRNWLVLSGTYGVGKTHLAAAVANHRLGHGDYVLFITAPDLLDHLRSTFTPSAEMAYDEMFMHIKDADILVIDDLGAENPSPWAQEKLFQLLNYRYTALLPTVITTNLSVDQLDGRLSSRLHDERYVRLVSMDLPDYRRSRTQMGQEEKATADAAKPAAKNPYAAMRFDNFNINDPFNTHDESRRMAEALSVCQEYLTNLNESDAQRWLLLTGAYGVGKTHLAAAVYNEYLATHDGGAYMYRCSDLLDGLRGSFGQSGGMSFEQRFHQLRTCNLLVVDDVSLETVSAWGREKLYQLFDYRYLMRIPTVVTTAQRLEKTDPRLLAWFLDRRVCRAVGLAVRSYSQRAYVEGRLGL